MNVKDLVRPLPGARQASLLRQRIAYADSARFWEQNYAQGETSGTGSYGALADGKSRYLNTLVREREVGSVIEFGCGDGNQLSLAEYPSYIGLDVSRTAIGLCQQRFAADPTKSFFLYDGTCFTDRAGLFTADLALSLDVVYHLTEDAVFETYLAHLFAAGQRLVVIYSTDLEMGGTAPHVRHRHFTPWVDGALPGVDAGVGDPGAEHRPGPGRLLRLRALVTSPVLILSPSRGLGGGIERYVPTVESAFTDRGVSYQRLDLTRSGPAGHRALLARAATALSVMARPARLVLGHRALLPVAALLARTRLVSGISVICHGSDVWGDRSGPRRQLESWLMRRRDVRLVAVSSFTAGALIPGGRATVLPPGLSRDWFGELADAAAAGPGRPRARWR